MSFGRTVGDLIDSLGVLAELEHDDLVPSVVVLLRTIKSDGSVALTIASSEGLCWLDQLGMVTAAQAIVTQGGYEVDD